MATCKNGYFNGWGMCKSLMEKMNGALIDIKGTTFTDAELMDSATLQTAIADDDASVRTTLALPIMSFENTTDDITINKTPLGKAYVDGKPIPTGTLYLDASICDYKQLHDLEGKSFELAPMFQDGTQWRTRKSDGTLKGFRFHLATKAGLPPEDKLQSYPLYLMFDSYSEFEDVVVVDGGYDFDEVFDFSPVGLDIRVITDYTGGDVVVKVTKRGSGDGLTGLTSSDFIVKESNATPTVAVTAASDDGLGVYTLTVKKDNDGTPANLAASDYVVIQAQDDDGTNLTYLSHALKFNGGA